MNCPHQAYFLLPYLLQDKAKPFARMGRKATGLKKTAGLPWETKGNRVALGAGKSGFLFWYHRENYKKQVDWRLKCSELA